MYRMAYMWQRQLKSMKALGSGPIVNFSSRKEFTCYNQRCGLAQADVSKTLLL